VAFLFDYFIIFETIMRNKLFIHILTFLFCFNFVIAFAQEKKDTIFFKENWKEISNRNEASFYRIIFSENNRIRVLDYYMSNVLKMEGYFSNLKEKNKEGYFRYYNDSGLISSEGVFKNNGEEGEWKYYDLGKIWSIKQFSDGRLHGQLQMFYNNG
jgi:antitoxin component YwqK of YwqJK toxin-antitoxin module